MPVNRKWDTVKAGRLFFLPRFHCCWSLPSDILWILLNTAKAHNQHCVVFITVRILALNRGLACMAIIQEEREYWWLQLLALDKAAFPGGRPGPVCFSWAVTSHKAKHCRAWSRWLRSTSRRSPVPSAFLYCHSLCCSQAGSSCPAFNFTASSAVWNSMWVATPWNISNSALPIASSETSAASAAALGDEVVLMVT